MADPTVTPLFGVPTAPQAAGAAPVAAPVAPKKYEEQDGKHKGVAGVARDILGTLGDFLLTRLHMPAMYGPAQKQRKLAAAQQNIDTDPVGSIQQVSSIDPVFGAKLRDQYIDNTRLAAQNASTTEARDARLAQAQGVQNDRTRSRVGAMLDTMGTWDDTKRQTNWPTMRQQALNYAKAQGLDLSSELPEAFDSVGLDSFIDGSVPTGTQRAQRLTKERIDNQDEQAGATLGERVRHNSVAEGQGAARVEIARRRADTAATNASRPRTARTTNIQSYTGEDGFKYTQRSDGTTVKSPTRVRPTGRVAAPADGTRRVVNGHTYEIRGGKPVRVQ